MKFNIGDRVALNVLSLVLSYVQTRKVYTNVYINKTGTVIGYSATGKVAVEFDEPVFIHQDVRVSSHNNGCHGRGKINHCWYFPECTLNEKISSTNDLLLL